MKKQKNLRKIEIEVLSKGNMKIIELKNTKTENSLDRLNGTVEIMGDNICELEDRTIEFTQSEQ